MFCLPKTAWPPTCPLGRFATLLLVPLGTGRVEPLAWPSGPVSGETSCPEGTSCPRCPASPRRAPDDCRSCVRVPEGVTARREDARIVRPGAQLAKDPGRRPAPDAARAETRAAETRHAVLGASPPTHLLLATLRN